MLTAENDAGVGVDIAGGGGCDCGCGCGGCTFTAVKPPVLTAVKPEDMADRGSSGGGVGAVTVSACIDAFSAADALMAGESMPLAVGVPWTDFFMGDGAGDGVKGPPFSNSIIWCTPGLTTLRYSSYG